MEYENFLLSVLFSILLYFVFYMNELSSRHINPLEVKDCKSAQKVRALAFNKSQGELAALSLNGYIHIWSADHFKQVN